MKRKSRLIHRPAFTLVELLVVIAIIGMLIGLLLPAVQSAREAARRMQCSNKVKQLTLAIHTYADANDSALPPYGGGPYGAANIAANDNPGRWSGLILLLPYIEQNALYDRFISERMIFGTWGARSIPASDGGANNPTTEQPSAFICPANAPTGKPDNFTGFTCYRFNYGDYPGGYSRNNQIRGPFGHLQSHTLSKITDGTSNTLCFSEKAVDDYGANSEGVKVTATSYSTGPPGGFGDGTISAQRGILVDRTICAGSAPDGVYAIGVGGQVSAAGYRYGWYWASTFYHVIFQTTLPPNSPSCYNRGSDYNALFSATSFHTGGVNASLMDGSVKFISNNIDSGTEKSYPNNLQLNPSGKSPFGVWGAYGTRNGGESIASL